MEMYIFGALGAVSASVFHLSRFVASPIDRGGVPVNPLATRCVAESRVVQRTSTAKLRIPPIWELQDKRRKKGQQCILSAFCWVTIFG